MSALKHALKEVAFRIPPQILKAVFLDRNHSFFRRPLSIDEVIMARVIRPRVMVDCDIAGGVDTFITISDLPAEMVNTATWVMHIPKLRTQDRSIISVQGVSFIRPFANNYTGIPTLNSGGLLQTAAAVMSSVMPPPNSYISTVELIGENTICITDLTALQANMYLLCVLGSDENLSHIKMRFYNKFAQLVTLAVKAYIYNVSLLEIDLAQLQGGAALGSFREVIDRWNDAEQEYQLFLDEKWKKLMVLNDFNARQRYVSSLIGLDR
jgi:hypothetical protein